MASFWELNSRLCESRAVFCQLRCAERLVTNSVFIMVVMAANKCISMARLPSITFQWKKTTSSLTPTCADRSFIFHFGFDFNWQKKTSEHERLKSFQATFPRPDRSLLCLTPDDTTQQRKTSGHERFTSSQSFPFPIGLLLLYFDQLHQIIHRAGKDLRAGKS